MANHIYPLAKKQMLQGGIDLSSVNVKALLVNVSGAGTLYAYSASHEFLSDVPSGARIATSGNLSGKAIGNDGSFDSDDPTFSHRRLDRGDADKRRTLFVTRALVSRPNQGFKVVADRRRASSL